MGGKIAASVMCADFLELGKSLASMERAGVEYIHYDIMDGSFVQNYTLGTDFVKKTSAATKIPADIHLMITEPERKLGWFEFGAGDYVSIHYEATAHAQRAIGMIKSRGAKPMLGLNPATPLTALDYLLEDLDAVLLMTVNPGFAGQKLVEQTLRKISDLKDMLIRRGYENIEIEVDGNVSFENALRMRRAGADIFVAGSSSIFGAGDFDENIARLREAIK